MQVLRPTTTVTEAPASEPAAGQPRHFGLLRDRTAWAMALAAVGVAVTAWQRPPAERGLHPTQFWAMKVHWNQCADVVVTGDSRTYRGVSPAALAQELGGAKVLNYGFDGNGYTREYLQATESLLRCSGARIVVLGITPHSLTPEAQRDNGFYLARRSYASTTPGVWDVVDAQMQSRLSPLGISGAIKAALGIRQKTYRHELCPDGWAASTKSPEDPQEALGPYRSVFHGNRVDQKIVEDLAEQVRQWSARCITVYAFRVPSSRGMVNLEDMLSGFDEMRVARQLQSAGAIWLDVPQTDYASYDGSHLRRTEAQRFSHDLGKDLHQHEAAAGPLKHSCHDGCSGSRCTCGCCGQAATAGACPPQISSLNQRFFGE